MTEWWVTMTAQQWLSGESPWRRSNDSVVSHHDGSCAQTCINISMLPRQQLVQYAGLQVSVVGQLFVSSQHYCAAARRVQDSAAASIYYHHNSQLLHVLYEITDAPFNTSNVLNICRQLLKLFLCDFTLGYLLISSYYNLELHEKYSPINNTQMFSSVMQLFSEASNIL